MKNNKTFGKSSSVDLAILINEENDFLGHIIVEADTLPVLTEVISVELLIMRYFHKACGED